MKYQCPKCKGTNIEVKAWIKLNQLENKSIKTSDIEIPETIDDSSDYWCNDCEENIEPEKIN